MSYMKIKPTDTLFFRGGKPFNAGVDSWSDSSFLPHPSVIWGAMFSVLFRQSQEIQDKVSDKADTTDFTDYLEIKHIYLYNEKDGRVLLPAPLDLFIDDDKKVVRESYIGDIITSESLKDLEFIAPNSDKNVKRADNHFIDLYYLTHRDAIKKLYHFDDFAYSESKIGIAINKTSKTADESKIYRIDLTQFKHDWSFLVEYESTMSFASDGLLKLGGESKSASYAHIDEPSTITNHKKRLDVSGESEFSIYFATPAIFEKGWCFDENDHFKIISASIGKPISIGGFDMKTNSHKKMYKAVPAGSVYVVKLNKNVESIKDLKERLSITCIDTKKGFGKFEILN